MRSLLDILNEEKSLVNRLEKIEKDVELAKVINTFSSESTEKEEAEKELFEVRAEFSRMYNLWLEYKYPIIN